MSRMIPTAFEMQLERVRAEEVTALKAQRDALLAALEALLDMLSGGYTLENCRKAESQARAAIKGAKL